MLKNGNYPYILKKRISGGHGHLSNTEALELFTKYRGKQLSHLVLSHLSENNNKPEIVESLFKQQAGHTRIEIATRYKETPVFQVFPGDIEMVSSPPKSQYTAPMQLTLF